MLEENTPKQGPDSHKEKSVLGKIVTIVIIALVIALMVGIYTLVHDNKAISTFAECKDAGGVILENYPEQCRINDQTFVNEEQTVDATIGYVGLSEQEALDKAARENIVARVVERDDEVIPVTMDFVLGRYNLHIRDGKVYHVEVERE